MRQVVFLLLIALSLGSCEFKLKPFEEYGNDTAIEVRRYDRLQSRYLTTGDFSAIQQMNTEYPMETRTLIEKIVQAGSVDDPEINNRFLSFYQDSTLQTIIADAEAEYANMDDINKQFRSSFARLHKWLPSLPMPMIYAQIGVLAQSIIVGNHTIGISLDKYLGQNYGIYKRYYPLSQRRLMNRANIVPDCLLFYLLSNYQLRDFDTRPQIEKDLHMGKVMWVVNKTVGREVWNMSYVKTVDQYMSSHKEVSVEELLVSNDYSVFR